MKRGSRTNVLLREIRITLTMEKVMTPFGEMENHSTKYNEMDTAEFDQAYLDILDELASRPVSTAELYGEAISA
jgi:hypothetical protein